MPTRNVCTVICRDNPANGEPEMLVVRSRSKNPTTGIKTEWRVKFPGGGQEGPNEPVEGTRDREVWQETHLAFRSSKEIWKKEIWEKGILVHIRYGYLVRYEDCYGELRKVFMNDNGDELDPPYWAPAATLGRSLFDKHQPLYLAACRELGIL